MLKSKVKCEICSIKWRKNRYLSRSGFLAQLCANNGTITILKKWWHQFIIQFKREWLCDIILDLFKPNYPFLLRNSFLVLVIPAMCIISFCLYTNSSAQTFICDNLWSKSLQTSQRPLWVMMSFILTLKGTFAHPPPLSCWLPEPMAILFTVYHSLKLAVWPIG